PGMMLHYVDPYMTYGPFDVGERTMDFFVLRQQESSLLAWMPEMRELLPQPLPEPRRNYRLDLQPHLAQPLPPAGGSGSIAVLEGDPDGLAAHVVLAGPGATFATPPATGTGGAFSCVVGGTLHHAGRTFAPMSLAWTPAGDPGLQVQSGA